MKEGIQKKKKIIKIIGITLGVLGLSMILDVIEALVIKYLHLGFLWNLPLGLKTTVGIVLIILGIQAGASFKKIKNIVK
jgi:hypothetical protein